MSVGGRADAGQEVTVWFGWSGALIRREVIQKTSSVPGGGANRAPGGGSGVRTEGWTGGHMNGTSEGQRCNVRTLWKNESGKRKQRKKKHRNVF